MEIEQLKEVFRHQCRKLEERPDVLYTEFFDEKKKCVFSMTFYAIRVEVVYCWKWEALGPPSVLYGRIYLNKNERLFLHLPELMCCLKAEDYRACYFPYIESVQRMECCFRALMAVIDDYIPAAERLVQSGGDKEWMNTWFQRDFFHTEKDSQKTQPAPEEPDPDSLQIMGDLNYRLESVMVSRYTELPAYQAFLLGNWEKSLKKYRKLEKNGLSDYERGLCRFMENEANRGFQPMEPECFALPEYRTFGADRGSWKGVGLLWVIWSVLFCGIIAVVNGFLSRGTIYYFSIPAWFGMVLAVLPALLGYFLAQKQIMKRMKWDKALQFHTMTGRHPVQMGIAAVAFAASVIGSLAFCIAVPQMSCRFFDDYAIICMEDDSEYRFDYDRVRQIFHISARYNIYGDRVERGSYVLLLEDGTLIDLDGSTSGEQSQRKLIGNLFPEMEIVEFDSDRDLPQLRSGRAFCRI